MPESHSPHGADDAGVRYRNLMSSTIRDLCHSYLAVADRNDLDLCVRTLHAAHLALCGAVGVKPALRSKMTGISRDSLTPTLASICRGAESVIATFDKVFDDETTTPLDMERWLATRGQELLKGMSYLIGDLLTEQNLYRRIPADTSTN